MSDVTRRREIYALLGQVFTGLVPRIEAAAALGWRWHEVSTAFVHEVGGQVVSHVGVLSYPAIVDGRRRQLAGVHAVATHPDHRRRGYYRQAMTAALAHIDASSQPAVLATDQPELYEPFGFRVVPEHLARLRHPPRVPGPAARRISADDELDCALVRRLLADREPVSNVLAAVDPGWLFGIDEVLETGGYGQLWYADDLDLLVAADLDGAVARVLDVVAAGTPSLAAVLGCLPIGDRTVELCFCPDRFDAGEIEWVPCRWDDAVWMVRGLQVPRRPLMMPALHRH